MKKNIKNFLAGLSLVAVIISGCSGSSPTPVADVAKEQVEAVPGFELAAIRSGDELLNTSDIDGPILYSFWASWCNYCQKEIPYIDSLYSEYSDELSFISVNVTPDDSVDGARGFIEQYGLQMPAYFDLDGIASSSLGVLAVPTVVLVDRQGRIVEKLIGPSAMQSGEEFVGKLDALIQIGKN
ncbi:TlpA family protein disulfide reductase [Paenibacillus brevis]|uniref:TlpA family protein disulfide reductase n=1 Tax=Paenibacillus brevis TaxID=2841508 RepID=A0ABS6FL41_9BACL|nr:TlpA disulfide reductase family protein [Paenibacillus brevis]MBU5670217.1 TlpA family protein disulfide reductase [Paenibacillus brevis]